MVFSSLFRREQRLTSFPRRERFRFKERTPPKNNGPTSYSKARRSRLRRPAQPPRKASHSFHRKKSSLFTDTTRKLVSNWNYCFGDSSLSQSSWQTWLLRGRQ